MKKRTIWFGVIAFLVVGAALLLVAIERTAEAGREAFQMMVAAKAINLHYSRHQVLPADVSEIDGLSDWDVVYYAPVSNADREGFIVAVQRQSRTSQRYYIRLGEMSVQACRHDELEDLLRADDRGRRAVGEVHLWRDVIRASGE